MVTVEELLKANKEYYRRTIEELENSKKGLIDLESWKNELPNLLKQRYDKDKNELSINARELVKLMDWKLRKGKFRPSLKKLIRENEDAFVIQTTKDAFKLLLDSSTELDEDEYVQLIRESITILNGLRGVGPATSSLILSLLNKITKLAPPFYSDEAAISIFGEEIKLKYTLPEYIKYLRLFYEINPEFKFDFTELEAGAWSLYLKDVFGFHSDDELSDQKREEKKIKPPPPPPPPPPNAAKKRRIKAEEIDGTVRKSKRSKKPK